MMWIIALIISHAVAYAVGWYRARWQLFDQITGRRKNRRG